MSDLASLAGFVQQKTGIALKPTQYPSLRAALTRAAGELEPAAFLALASGQAGSPLVDRLLDEVTVKETSFLRDPRQLATIDWPELLRTARAAGSHEVRIWSAGCATGEEPYTLALLAQEAFGSTSPPVRILATDISGAALAAARAGRYRPRAVRELNDALLERYFTTSGDEYEVGASLRAAVEFRRHNLVADPIPPLGTGPFELIVCRNVVIYFDARTVDTLVGSLEQALSPGGTLLLGAADALCTFANRPIPPLQTRVGRPRRAARPRPRPRPHAPIAPLEAAPTQAEPLDAGAYFLRGLAELEAGETERAIASLRRALYLDPHFGLAAFTLARAHDIAGDTTAARRGYNQALRSLEGTSERHEALLEQVDLADITAVCRTRLEALR